MTIITDSDLHDSLCQICIESPHSLLSELGYAAKQKIIETTVCISYKKGDLIYQEGDMPTGLHCLLTGKAKIYKEGIGGRQQIVRMAKPIGFIRALATDLGFSHRRTVTLTQKHIRGRLAEALLVLKETYGYEADGCTLKICLTREDLANLSNMTTANAIRTLSNFATEGIVGLNGKKIKIIDKEKLEQINNQG